MCIRDSATDDYLVALRLITEREKAVLIFDEVMTGFRVAYGGADVYKRQS